jgi:hypothetical protein
MIARPTLVLVAALAATPASAAQCPYGQIYRVHLDECVGIRSALARAYVQPVRRLTRRVADADAPPYPFPAPPEKPPPADDQATLVEPLVLPDLEDGAPTIWRLCQAAPNLCKASER